VSLNLTEKEMFVAKHVTLGYTNRQIAASLNTSEIYVRCLLMKVYNKTGMFNKVELVKYMLDNKYATLPKRKEPEFHRLTQREKDVVSLIFQSYTTDEISKELKIDKITVRRYLSRVYSKLNVKSRSQLMAILVYNASHEASSTGVHPQEGT
jgi:DNA-binding CsgD family transcriptional regulator